MPRPSPLVTIAIPAFNHERFVKQALDSTLDSGLTNIEVVVCDDASSDATPAIIRQWGERHGGQFARFEFIERETNAGLCAALNEIVRAARGEILHVLGSDDYFLPGGIAAKTSAMLEHAEWDAAFSDGQAVGYDGEHHAPSLLAAGRIDAGRLTPALLAEELLYHWDMPANLLSWRTCAFAAHGGAFAYDETVFCEDFDSAWWAMRRQALGFAPAVCCAYRVRSWPQTSNRNPIREHRDIGRVLGKNARYFEPQIRDAMRTLADAHLKLSAGELDEASLLWKRHEENRARYEERIASETPEHSLRL